MTGRLYEFPTGKEQPTSWLHKWSIIAATVRLLGVRRQPVPEHEGVFTEAPVFVVGLTSFGTTEKFVCTFETTGVEDLHTMLNLLVDAAHQRGDGFSITDYTQGVAGLPESCAIENQI